MRSKGDGMSRVRLFLVLSLLEDPRCFVQRAAQQAPFEVEGKVAPENLVRSYPVRDVAAGALQRLGYVVTFDGKHYRAQAASASTPSSAR